MTAIVADDITGATDTGIHFAKSGAATYLSVGPTKWTSVPENTEVVAVDTDTRLASEETASNTVTETVRSLRDRGVKLIYKKIDSTMRGNPGIEIEAALNAGGYDFAVLSPAAPSLGRTVINGTCLVRGVPLRDSESGRDPFSPVDDSDIPSLVSRQSAMESGVVPLSAIRSGGEALHNAIRVLIEKNKRVLCFDAENQKDLESIAGQPYATFGRHLFVGSTGLAEAICPRPKEPPPFPHFESSRLMIVVGSLMETSRRQAERVAVSGRVSDIVVDADLFVENPDATARRITAEIQHAFDDRRHILLRTRPGEREKLLLDQPVQNHEVLRSHAAILSDFMGRMAELAYTRYEQNDFLVVGGGTLRKTMRSWKIGGVTLVNELLPGVPFGYADISNKNGAICIVSKSGGFGSPDTLLDILDVYKGLTRK